MYFIHEYVLVTGAIYLIKSVSIALNDEFI